MHVFDDGETFVLDKKEVFLFLFLFHSIFDMLTNMLTRCNNDYGDKTNKQTNSLFHGNRKKREIVVWF